MVNKKEDKKVKVVKDVAPSADDLIKKIVETLAPEMNKSIEKKFEDMKVVFTNELKDIRNHLDTPSSNVPETVPDTHVMPDVSGNTPDIVPQGNVSPPMPVGLESLMPLITSLLGNNNKQQGGGLNNMFMEAVMRKSLADITRGDMMNELMMKKMYQQVLGEKVPDDIMGTTESLMNPLRKYGENMKKKQDNKDSQ